MGPGVARRAGEKGRGGWRKRREDLPEDGEPDAEVVALGEDIGADMIVVGSRGMGRLRRPIGSVSSSIVAHAHCPVLVVRGGAG